jgi:nicotinamidase-related amidase
MIGLSRTRAALLVVDIQERLLAVMPQDVAAAVVRNTVLLIETAARLGLPVIVSQQYPRGLGATAAPIEDALAQHAQHRLALHRFDKLTFSAAAAPELASLAPTLGRDQWIVCGMEAHVCVYQTVRDLVQRGFQTHVATDAICSRTKANWKVGVDLAARTGAVPTSTEVCVFELLGRAGSPEFKALSKALR